MSANVRQVLPGFMRGQHSELSGIRDAVYHSDRQELQITFASGRTFVYCEVPQRIYDAYIGSPMRGAFFNIAIRGRFQVHEVTLTQPSSRH
jgi:hypothetical protein